MLTEIPIPFLRQDVVLSGLVLRNTPSLAERQPAVVVTGSWLTVKEQMPLVYAGKLAELGYTAFIFDFTGFGESRGEPRQAEIPSRKIADIHAAAAFLSTLSFVKPGAVGHLAICASAQYTLAAIAGGAPISSFVSVAGWFHDTASVMPFYGGADGVARRIAGAQEALRRFMASGEVRMVPAYRPGDETAGMFFELDYYAKAQRGAVPAWRNEMAALSWLYWLTFDGLSAADRVSTPTLMVHGDDCVLPANARAVHDRLKGQKRLLWTGGAQTDFYDQPAAVATAVAAAQEHFGRTL